ncbi:hypothetical protein [Exiguobacterium sp. TNDT2]|uniref:hypothetical protein n=1 Tax=Exiguobacterium sp. TNDT2 TaxID=2233531 RepID=UPI000DEF3A46|nr:hypothetical protein [Exiguobacterium sp. TNDT2]
MYKPLTALMLALFVIFNVQTADAATAPYKTVQSTQLKANTKSGAKTLQTLKANTRLSVISKTNTWAYVQVGKTKGYVMMRSLIPLEIPIKQFDYNEVMTYKGTDIISIGGKGIKIDPALLPFFKQNAEALRSTFVQPVVKNNTLVKFEKLTIGFFAPVNKTFTIDKNAAARIDSLSLQVRNAVTITTTAPLRQVVLNASPHFAPLEDEALSVTLNGPIQQFHSDGVFTLKGKGSIERWDLAKETAYSFIIPALYNGEVGLVNMKNSDGVIRGSNTFNVRAVSGPSKASLIDGTNGILGATKVTKIIQGKRMGREEKAIDQLWSKMTTAQLESLLKQLSISYTPDRMDAYVTAFKQNHGAGVNKRLVASKEDVRFIIQTVDTVLTSNLSSPPYVSIDAGRVTVKTNHLVKARNESTVPYKRNVTAIVKDGVLQSITFKREEDPTIDLKAYEHDNGRYLTTTAPGSYRVVTIDDGMVKGFTYIIQQQAELDRLYGKGYFELVQLNGNAPATYNQPAPVFEAKIVKHGYATYLVVRSSDRDWMKNVHSYTLPVNKNYIAGGPVIADKIDIGDWNPNDSVVLSHYDGKINDGLIVKAYGYQNAKQK